MAKIELKNLSKTYNKKIEALHDINFTIEDGQFFVLLGPSGAGKTTTLRCIAGLEKIDNGSILFNDESVTEDQPASRDVCFVFQQYSLYPHYSVYENLTICTVEVFYVLQKIPSEIPQIILSFSLILGSPCASVGVISFRFVRMSN